jgi:benzoyl-CoA reductase/2-hydroxyglutaryl-CoA dehydratase subunit BcrC/BadD/HgdB
MRKLEEFAGIELTAGMLEESIVLHNEQRALVRELYELKREDPPPISGVETLQLLVAVCSLPVEEGNTLLRESIREVKERTDGPEKQPFRFLMWGSPLDDTVLTEMIEGCGVNVVIDDTCLGSRVYWDDVKSISDPVEDLARHYLVDIRCPRTFREMGSTYEADLESRFGYIKDLVTKWQANGAILQSMKYCDTHGYEVPALQDYLKGIGMPAFYLEHEYMMVALAPLKTRVQAFLEMLE